MDKDTLDEERINKCRYAITCEDGVFSFCAYNNLFFKNPSSAVVKSAFTVLKTVSFASAFQIRAFTLL
jgi:uncharacterized radical SAM superfamily Fe-S cluster-containing enzyme